jgi:hypothetical protein
VTEIRVRDYHEYLYLKSYKRRLRGSFIPHDSIVVLAVDVDTWIHWHKLELQVGCPRALNTKETIWLVSVMILFKVL